MNGNWDKFLKRLEKRGWKLIHEDDHSLIFEHKTFGKVVLTTTVTQERILEILDKEEKKDKRKF
jgi:predicted RNA binding protein YcfA (HicA-like mRNA interferase family)